MPKRFNILTRSLTKIFPTLTTQNSLRFNFIDRYTSIQSSHPKTNIESNNDNKNIFFTRWNQLYGLNNTFISVICQKLGLTRGHLDLSFINWFTVFLPLLELCQSMINIKHSIFLIKICTRNNSTKEPYQEVRITQALWMPYL